MTKPQPRDLYCNGSNCLGLLVLQAKRLPSQPDTPILHQTSASIIFCKYLTIESYRIPKLLDGNSKLNGATNKEIYWR